VSKIKDLRKKEIIEASLDLVEKGGLKSVTTKNVANAVKISESSLYNIFESKDKLILETIKYLYERRKEMTAVIFEKNYTSVSDVVEAIVSVLKDLANDKYCNADLAISLDRVLACDKDVQNFLQQCAKDDLETVTYFLKQLEEKGLILESKFKDASYTLLVFVIGHIYYNLMFKDKNENDERFERILRRIFEIMSR
jgi:AcrR family transcriptional regulator